MIHFSSSLNLEGKQLKLSSTTQPIVQTNAKNVRQQYYCAHIFHIITPTNFLHEIMNEKTIFFCIRIICIFKIVFDK